MKKENEEETEKLVDEVYVLLFVVVNYLWFCT